MPKWAIIQNLISTKLEVGMKASLIFCIIAMACMLIFTGCSQKQATPTMQDPQTQTTQADDPSKRVQTQQPISDKDKLPKETITERQQQPLQREDIRGTIRELETKIKDIYFGFDRYDIDEKAKPMLKMAADILSSNRKIKVIIEGHCDERGTREYNLGLGERRANAVKEFLVSLGIPSKRIDTVSYGKEKPQCTEKTEECWAKNRRAHFVFVEELQ